MVTRVFALLLIINGLFMGPAQAGVLRDRLQARMQQRAAPVEIAYGKDPKQKFDVYAPGNAKNAPVIVMVHGGAWKVGDKSNGRVTENKIAHWLPQGFIFISVNYRLSPAAAVQDEADDVASALAYIQKNAALWGGDPDKIILMGHSAGAHLVALLSADPARIASFGVKPWRGTIVLDSAALDLVEIMKRKHYGFYDDVFGSDPATWPPLSPIHRMKPDVLPMLVVCSTKRDDSCPPSYEFTKLATALSAPSQVLEQNLTHEEINETLGLPGAYTQTVDDFIQTLLKK